MLQRYLTLLFILISFAVYADNAYRMIAIMENERLLRAEPDIQLSTYLNSADTKIKIGAILAAGRIGNPAVLSLLEQLAKDHDLEVRREVAFALGQIKSRKSLPSVFELMKDKDPKVQRLAIEAAGRIGGLETTEKVLPFLDSENPLLREQAGLSLALIKDRSTVPVLIEKSKKQDPAQWSYVYALYRLADRRSIPVLHEVLANPSASPTTGDPSSILFALKAFWTLKEPLIDAEYKSMLQHSDQRVRQNALDVAAATGRSEVCSAIRDSAASMNNLTRLKSIEVMATLKCANMDEKMKLLGDPQATIRAAAIQLITKEEKDELLPVFQHAVSDESWIVRSSTARAIPGMGKDYALMLLQKLMADSDSAVRQAAIESLGEYMPDAKEILEPLLISADFTIRGTAAEILAKTNNPDYISALIHAYAMSTDPSEIEGRAMILDALSSYHDSRALSIFSLALKDPEYAVRQRAIEAMKKMNGSEWLQNGKLRSVDDFLFPDGAVSKETQAKYPANFGEPLSDSLVEMQLAKGKVVIRLFGKDAPLHAMNFKKLAQEKVYDGLRIHRVVPNFVIQGGDPRGDGWGSAGTVVHDQMNRYVYKRGMVGMPLAGKDTGGSQFFITMSRQPHLDGNYTIFGEVVSGMEVVDQTEIGDLIQSVRFLPETSKN
ncbi:MAG TPA: HEAT repeat domain-containing protein [Acidobacteriota bacterium]|nr:HEAT repeat domain-containing protein [Acidobacteriota bacterium]